MTFSHAALPQLEGVDEGHFANVFCETVIMHLPLLMIEQAVAKLVSLLRPGGVLYLSWRVTKGADRRDEFGRLYAAFDPHLVFLGLGICSVLYNEQVVSQSSGKMVRRIVAQRPAI